LRSAPLPRRSLAQALIDRVAGHRADHTLAADYLDELRAYASVGNEASVADNRADLLAVAGLRDLAAADLEEARRLQLEAGRLRPSPIPFGQFRHRYLRARARRAVRKPAGCVGGAGA